MALLIAGSPRSALDGQLTASRVALKAADQSLAVVVDLDQRGMAVGTGFVQSHQRRRLFISAAL